MLKESSEFVAYHITMLFGARTYSQKNVCWEMTENAGVPILYITVNFRAPTYKGTKKRNNMERSNLYSSYK